ncbi:MAG TPA: hypothetical protein VNN07_09910, partial [Candidatus Tectomicrobia bacterium]|nr:hypothetical protein [Candidatus Tectomicrobia bacterium]
MKPWSILAALALSTAACAPDPCHRLAPGEAAVENACRTFPGLEEARPGAELVRVAGEITADTHWTADRVWVLRDFVFVRGPAVLRIDPGTEIRGERGSALVIARGAKIIAEGTREQPIVFTSSKPPGARYRGDWGGVNLLGRAPLNIAGGENALSGMPISNGLGFYGGDDPEDSSGVMRFVRIEFAGYPLTPDTKLNGFTCAGCGRGTVLEYLQVHRAADDGIEFFGGT